MGSTTTRLAIPFPVGSDPNNVPTDVQSLATRLDLIAVDFASGTAATFAGTSPANGLVFWNTTTHRLYWGDGSTWWLIGADGLVSAKGDLLIGTAAGTLGRLAAGADGQAVIYDSTQTTGMRAGNPAASSLAGPASLTTYTETLVDLGSMGASKALDLSLAREFKGTLTANCTLSVSNVPGAANIRLAIALRLVQDATGSRIVTWPASFNWGSAGAPTLTTTANKADVIGAISDDNGTTWLAFLAGQGF